MFQSSSVIIWLAYKRTSVCFCERRNWLDTECDPAYLISSLQQRGKGESVRRDGGANPKPPSYMSRHSKYTPASLAKEARETVKSVKSLIEEERKFTLSALSAYF